ncbi:MULTISPECIES: hypothetical protein [Streptomyces]|uniref:Uncharacterized protein n=1 Tax=Streptomyces drozdowiczii TaxID=202862 RepID=A0ABY6PPA0_9ACTN|nr:MULTISPECIES: hypothetical protein [Streptomyces]MCX0246616.1 hypothetical protein [Streptomyces drozdowiczii]OKJ72323.1 hypothetical protein AMK30_21475 [Streptomyces sp. CB02460]UZK53906.1 hypothetical protein NEH16_06840 [Streptomyces drozdowiczii]
MNKGLRTAAVAAALVTGMVAAGSAPAAAAGRAERITSQEQLAAHLAEAVAVEQANGAVDTGVVGGLVVNTTGVRPASC